MNATTVAVDLAKSVFQLAVADDSWRVVETHCLARTQFERWFAKRDVRLVIMEPCGSARICAAHRNDMPDRLSGKTMLVRTFAAREFPARGGPARGAAWSRL